MDRVLSLRGEEAVVKLESFYLYALSLIVLVFIAVVMTGVVSVLAEVQELLS